MLAAYLTETTMDFGLGLPISNPASLPDWARRAETAGFASLALLDRLAYDNPEPLVALSMLAGATSRIRLQTEVLLGPLRQTALLAKQAATLDRMSGGRFVLGLGIGGREDDYAAVGVPLGGRGQALERQLVSLREIWSGEAFREPVPSLGVSSGPASATAEPKPAISGGALIGPAPLTPGGPRLLIGGFAPAALGRVARYADGFICAAPLTWAEPLIRTVREQWLSAGRPGRPRIVCQVNVAVGGPDTIAQARAAIARYYAFTGRGVWGEPLIDPGEIAEAVAAYRELGADELVFYCYGEDSRQVEDLAAVVC